MKRLNNEQLILNCTFQMQTNQSRAHNPRMSIIELLYSGPLLLLLLLSPTLCDPMDGSPPGSPVPGVLQARTLEWVAISFSNAWKWKGKVKLLSHVWFLATPWTVAHQAPPSIGFSRQEPWRGVPLPSPGPLLPALITPDQLPHN